MPSGSPDRHFAPHAAANMSAPTQGEGEDAGATMSEEEKQEATMAECLRLLSDDSREKKFVGMLLVTRLLPNTEHTDDTALQAIAGGGHHIPMYPYTLAASPSWPGDSSSHCALIL